MKGWERVAAALTCGALVLAPAAASAARPTLPTRPWKVITVAVLPVAYLGGLVDPFVDTPADQHLRTEAARWHRGLEVAFGTRDQIAMIGSAEIRERLDRQLKIQRSLVLARERYALGLEQWRALHAKEALAHLDRARDLHLEAFSDLADRRALADVELHRGLALFDLGEVGPARIAFAQMFALDPTRRFERGYYGAAIEQELAGAAVDIATTPAPAAVLWPPERLSKLGTRLRIDVWVLGSVERAPDDGARRLRTLDPNQEAAGRIELALFDLRTSGYTLHELFRIGSVDYMREDLDRIVSAWHSCALEAPSMVVRPRARRRWAVELGYTHAVWLHHRRTRDYLHGPGAHVAVAFMPTRGLELWAKTSQRATLSDVNADLLDVFTTTHVALGAGLGIGGSRVTFVLRAGVEMAFSLADIEMTTDVDCKFFGPESDRCRGIFRAESPALWLGLDFSASLRVAPTRAWYLGLSAGTTIYAVSGDLVGELNFPLYGTFAFGLPF